MLSPGNYHLDVPKDEKENLLFRRFWLNKAKESRSVQRMLKEICRRDILFYVNTFVVQFNPLQFGDEARPFVTWDFQDRHFPTILKCIDDKRDLVVEKSREMGATWMFLIVADWLCLFHQNKTVLMVSKSADAVDNKASTCLFWKLDFMHDHLPDWMKGHIDRNAMYYGFENGSEITGEASTGRAGVSGRASIMFVDEFPQIKEAKEVLARTSDTCETRFFNGTHLGTDTPFFDLTQRPDWRKLVIHWSEHPRKSQGLYRFDEVKNQIEVLDKTYEYPVDFSFVRSPEPTGGPYPGIRSPWYDRQLGRKGGSARQVAMDLDINPTGSVSQFVSPMLVRDLIANYAEPTYWEGELHYDRQTGQPDSEPLVTIPGGKVKLWMIPTLKGFPPGKYAGGADIAEGTGATPSCLSFWDALTGKKILEYIDPNIKPEDFAILAVAICLSLRDDAGQGAKFCWERQGPGDRFGKKVLALGYRNIYFHPTNDLAAPWAKKESETPGWYPNNQARTSLLGDYRDDLAARRAVNPSEYALKQLLHFRYDQKGLVEYGGPGTGDDYSGAGVNHGDIVIADGLGWKMASELGVAVRKVQEEIQSAPPGSLAWRRKLSENQRRSSWHRQAGHP